MKRAIRTILISLAFVLGVGGPQVGATDGYTPPTYPTFTPVTCVEYRLEKVTSTWTKSNGWSPFTDWPDAGPLDWGKTPAQMTGYHGGEVGKNGYRVFAYVPVAQRPSNSVECTPTTTTTVPPTTTTVPPTTTTVPPTTTVPETIPSTTTQPPVVTTVPPTTTQPPVVTTAPPTTTLPPTITTTTTTTTVPPVETTTPPTTPPTTTVPPTVPTVIEPPRVTVPPVTTQSGELPDTGFNIDWTLIVTMALTAITLGGIMTAVRRHDHRKA